MTHAARAHAGAARLQANSAGAKNSDKEALHIGAVAFIDRFGSSVNEHVHFRVCAVDGVFEEVAARAVLIRTRQPVRKPSRRESSSTPPLA